MNSLKYIIIPGLSGRNSLLLVAFMFVAGYVYAQDDGSIKIRNWKVEKKPVVKEDTSHIFIEPAADADKDDVITFCRGRTSKPAPDDSLAVKIRDHKKRVTWQPKWRYRGLGGPWLPTWALSADQSVFAVVETSGESDGPNGSRIFFYDTYSLKIIRYLNFKDKKIARICFVPGTVFLACWVDKQVILKQPPELMLINCRNGRIIAENKKITEKISVLQPTPDGRQLFVGSAYTDLLRILDSRDLSIKGQIVFPQGVNGFAFSQDGKEFAVGSKGSVQFFRFRSRKKNGSVKLFSDRVAKIIFAGDKEIAVVSDAGKVILCCPPQKRELFDNAMPILNYLPEKRQLAVFMKLRTELRILEMPLLKKLYSAYPLSLKPKTRKAPLFSEYLKHYESFLILDGDGSLYLVYKPGRKWRKYLIFSATK